MASDMSSVRSGPSLNSNWSHAFQQITTNNSTGSIGGEENSVQIERALYEIQKERCNWMHRCDLLIRASRHYEGKIFEMFIVT